MAGSDCSCVSGAGGELDCAENRSCHDVWEGATVNNTPLNMEMDKKKTSRWPKHRDSTNSLDWPKGPIMCRH
jgi:hypothetical protein